MHSWVQPRHVGMLGLLGLLLKYSENTSRRITGFEPVSERVHERVHLGAFFVCFQSIIKN